jgi:hypothetical protein
MCLCVIRLEVELGLHWPQNDGHLVLLLHWLKNNRRAWRVSQQKTWWQCQQPVGRVHA